MACWQHTLWDSQSFCVLQGWWGNVVLPVLRGGMLVKWRVALLPCQKWNCTKFFPRCASTEAGSTRRMEKQSFLLKVLSKTTSSLLRGLNERRTLPVWSMCRSVYGLDGIEMGVPIFYLGRAYALRGGPESGQGRIGLMECRNPCAGVSSDQHSGAVPGSTEERLGWSQGRPLLFVKVCKYVWENVWVRECERYASVRERVCVRECRSVCVRIWKCMWVCCVFVRTHGCMCVSKGVCVCPVKANCIFEATSEGLL